MRHRGETVGHFFLAEKESAPAFTAEDEEVLVLFASQAATAIANARSHRDEQRAQPKEAQGQDRRGRGEPDLDLQRARRGLPHAEAGRKLILPPRRRSAGAASRPESVAPDLPGTR